VASLQGLAASRPASWFFVNVSPHIDRRLLRWSNGRLSVAIGQPVALLELVGAKSGEVRRTPLLYTTDGDDIVVIASRGGDTRHPAWFHNLKKNPEVTVYAPGRTGDYVARVASGQERERLWQKAVQNYSGYETYKDRAGARQIPVVVLTLRP
jgi:deazaflavin-dependent oxidoreductase (nitroreductase family)